MPARPALFNFTHLGSLWRVAADSCKSAAVNQHTRRVSVTPDTPPQSLAIPLDSSPSSACASSTLPPLIVPQALSNLDSSHHGAYFPTKLTALAPEAMGAFAAAFHPSNDAGHRRRSACLGVKAELQYSRGDCLMYRPCMHQLIAWLQSLHPKALMATPATLSTVQDALKPPPVSVAGEAAAAPRDLADSGREDSAGGASASSKAPRRRGARVAAAGGMRLLLRGPTGSGKSVALATLVEWARANGWLVLYIPSAHALTRGGYFVRRESNGAEATPLYDTPVAAKVILTALLHAHAARLKNMLCRKNEWAGKSLQQLALQGLAAQDARAVVECCLAVLDELLVAAAETPVLVAIDDYNSLFWLTDYGASPLPEAATMTPGRYSPGAGTQRTLLAVDQLPLASAFRLLRDSSDTGPRHRAVVVAALGWSRGVSPRVQVPSASDATTYVPRFSQAEVANALAYYHQCGRTPEAPSGRQVQQLLAITNGNAKELRDFVPKMGLLKLNLV